MSKTGTQYSEVKKYYKSFQGFVNINDRPVLHLHLCYGLSLVVNAIMQRDPMFSAVIWYCGWITYEMNTLITVLITGRSWSAVILMRYQGPWAGGIHSPQMLFCVCLGLSNWPIRCSTDPHTPTPSTSVPTRGGSVCLIWAYFSQIDQASCGQLWPSSPVAVWNVWHRPPFPN